MTMRPLAPQAHGDQLLVRADARLWIVWQSPEGRLFAFDLNDKKYGDDDLMVQWPEILPHYRHVRFLERQGFGRGRVEMAAWREFGSGAASARWPTWWVSEMWIEPEVPLTSAYEGLHSVRRFVEKPNAKLANELWHSGALWNTFVLVARVSALLRMFSRSGGPAAPDASVFISMPLASQVLRSRDWAGLGAWPGAKPNALTFLENAWELITARLNQVPMPISTWSGSVTVSEAVLACSMEG